MNDTYTFNTTAPTMTNGDVLNAITKLQNFAEEYEFVHIVGESDLALWQAVGEAQVQLFEVFHKPMFFVMEAGFPTPSELAPSWAGAPRRATSPTGPSRWRRRRRR